MLAMLAPVLVFGLVIFVHEFGHFLAAKALGVYAPRFSIGFGPSIFRFRRGETEYVLAILPLGGYVRMASRNDAETAFLEGGSEEATAKRETDPDFDPEAMIPFGPKPVPEHRWFESKPLWARLIILLAGVIMNVLLGIVISTVLAFHYGQSVYPSTVIGAVHPVAGAPALSQLQVGDTIRAVNGGRVSTWNDVLRELAGSGRDVTIETQRGAVRVPLNDSVTVDAVGGAIVYYIPPVVDSVSPGQPAAAAGFRHGDSVAAVAGQPIRSWSDMVAVVGASAGKPVTFDVVRSGQHVSLTATPYADSTAVGDSTAAKGTAVGRIGAQAVSLARTDRIGMGQAVVVGVKLTWTEASAITRAVHQITTGAMSVKQLAGPVGITKASVAAARSGIDDLFYLIAFLSVNLAVVNLFPIPILDGGQILVNVLEAVKGSPFSARTREYILRVGLLAIALIFVLVMYNDTRGGVAEFVHWVGRLFG